MAASRMNLSQRFKIKFHACLVEITRFAICFYIVRLSLFDFEMAEAVIDKVQ